MQCLAVPILALVQDSPDVFVFVQAIAIFSQNFTVLVLIFGPKMYKVFLGQADPAGTAVSGRSNNPRFSLSNRPGLQAEHRTSMMSASGALQRTESSDRDGSTQFLHPMTVTFQEEGAGSSGNADQFRRLPGDKTSSFRRSTDVWMSGEIKNSSEGSPISSRVPTNSIKEESIIEEGESKEMVVVDMTSILEITDTTPREDAKDDLTANVPLAAEREILTIPEESIVNTESDVAPCLEESQEAAVTSEEPKEVTIELNNDIQTTTKEEPPVNDAQMTSDTLGADHNVNTPSDGQESKGQADLVSEPSDVVSA